MKDLRGDLFVWYDISMKSNTKLILISLLILLVGLGVAFYLVATKEPVSHLEGGDTQLCHSARLCN